MVRVRSARLRSVCRGDLPPSAPCAFDSLPAVDQPGKAHRRALPGKRPGPARLHADLDLGAETARLAGRDLAGKHPLVPRCRRTRSQDSAASKHQIPMCSIFVPCSQYVWPRALLLDQSGFLLPALSDAPDACHPSRSLGPCRQASGASDTNQADCVKTQVRRDTTELSIASDAI
jgi:hypothetical protein